MQIDDLFDRNDKLQVNKNLIYILIVKLRWDFGDNLRTLNSIYETLVNSMKTNVVEGRDGKDNVCGGGYDTFIQFTYDGTVSCCRYRGSHLFWMPKI